MAVRFVLKNCGFISRIIARLVNNSNPWNWFPVCAKISKVAIATHQTSASWLAVYLWIPASHICRLIGFPPLLTCAVNEWSAVKSFLWLKNLFHSIFASSARSEPANVHYYVLFIAATTLWEWVYSFLYYIPLFAVLSPPSAATFACSLLQSVCVCLLVLKKTIVRELMEAESALICHPSSSDTHTHVPFALTRQFEKYSYEIY